MRINDNEFWERIIIILCAISIILAAHNMNNSKKEEYATIPEDIKDIEYREDYYAYNEIGKMDLVYLLNLTKEEREYINEYYVLPNIRKNNKLSRKLF